MMRKKNIRTIAVAGVLSLMLGIPVCTPAANIIPGAPEITTQAEAATAQTLSIKECKKRLRKKLREDGYTTNYTFEFFKSYKKTYAFGIIDCSNGSSCNAVGYAEVNKYTGKVRYEMGCPDGNCG